MKINLHIERLVLEGIDVPAGPKQSLQTAVQAELLRVLSAAAPEYRPRQDLQAERLQVEPIQLNTTFDAKDFCFQVASTVSGGIFHE